MNNKFLIIDKSILISVLKKHGKLRNKALARVMWEILSRSEGAPDRISLGSGNKARPHMDIRNRLARLGQGYGQTEYEATLYSIWLRRHLEFRCAYCSEPVPYTDKIGRMRQVDHVTALANGGRHCVENLVPSCTRCNMLKGTNEWAVPVVAKCLLPEAWRANPKPHTKKALREQARQAE